MSAIVSLALSGYSLLYESDIHDDKVWYDSYYARVACGLMVGYMVAGKTILKIVTRLTTCMFALRQQTVQGVSLCLKVFYGNYIESDHWALFCCIRDWSGQTN